MPLPTTTDLATYLTAVGLTPIPTTIFLQRAIDEGVEAFERASGRNLQPSVSVTTKKYDGIRNLGKQAILEIDDCHTVSVVKVDGKTLVEGTDYRLLRASFRSGPVEAIEFYRIVPMGWNVLEVTAIYAWPSIPASVSGSILDLAFSQLRLNPSSTTDLSDVKRQKLGDREIEYKDGKYSDAESVKSKALKIAQSYRRMPHV